MGMSAVYRLEALWAQRKSWLRFDKRLFNMNKFFLVDGTFIELAEWQWLNSQECLQKVVTHALNFYF